MLLHECVCVCKHISFNTSICVSFLIFCSIFVAMKKWPCDSGPAHRYVCGGMMSVFSSKVVVFNASDNDFTEWSFF